MRTIDESIADLKAVTLDDVKKFHADFYGASHGELAAAGDFEEVEILELTGSLFNGWKTPRPYARVGDTFKDVAPVNQSLETPDKANAVYIAGQNLNVRDDEPDYPALVLGNYMLGGGFLNSRLATRIRQKDGLSYSVGLGLQVSSLDKNGRFLVQAIYAPENRARLEAAVADELALALKDGFTEEELKAAKTGWLQSREVSRAQDAELAGRLNTLQFLGRTIAWDAELDRKVAALTPAAVKAAIARHLDPAKLSIIKAGDFAKVAK